MANGEGKVRKFDVVTLVLTIIALAIAVVHLMELGRTVERIETIQHGLSTQYLGAYPAFFSKIAQVVSRARKNLVIVCDFAAYGSFSDPSTAEDYFYAIRKRRRFTNLEVTVLNSAGSRRLLEALFTDNQWSDWQKDAEKRAKVNQFLKQHGKPPDSIKARQDLLKALNDVNDQVIDDVFHNSVNRTQLDIPIYFWIADCDEAVFTIASPRDGVEHGFYTSDKSLIRSLLDLRKRYGAPSSPVNRCD